MEIKSFGWEPGICKTVGVSQWLIPETLTDPLDGVDYAIDLTKEKLSESKAVKSIKTEIRMPLDEYRHLISAAVTKGQRDAWDLARRVVGSADDCYEYSEINKVFNANTISSVFNMSPLTALKIDMRYQEGEKRALHVGDEVEFINSAGTIRGYVVNIISTTSVRVLTKDCGTYTIPLEKCKKTGNTNAALIEALNVFDNLISKRS